MGLTSFGLGIGVFCAFLYSILLLSVILGLDFLEPALFRLQHRTLITIREQIIARERHARAGARTSVASTVPSPSLSITETARAAETAVFGG